MELTVKQLREAISGLDDDVIIADLGYGNSKFRPFVSVKRLLLLEDGDGKKYLTINGLGSHFTATGDQAHLSHNKEKSQQTLQSESLPASPSTVKETRSKEDILDEVFHADTPEIPFSAELHRMVLEAMEEYASQYKALDKD